MLFLHLRCCWYLKIQPELSRARETRALFLRISSKGRTINRINYDVVWDDNNELNTHIYHVAINVTRHNNVTERTQNALPKSSVVRHDFTCLLMYGNSFSVSRASNIHSLRRFVQDLMMLMFSFSSRLVRLCPWSCSMWSWGPPAFLCMVRRRDRVVVVAPM